MCAALYDTHIHSTYGPCGRSKILIGSGGEILVTRDGGQLLQYACSTQPALLPAIAMLLEFQDRHADGAVTLGMVMSHLCCRAQQCSAESTREETRLRVCTDRALMHLQRVVSSARRYGLLQEAFVCAGLWRHVPLDRLRVRQLWMTMLIPSTNQNLAERIADLMCDWLLCGDYDGCLGDAARSALLHFDITVLSVRGPDLQGSFRLPADTVAVRGSCREASAILRGELPGAFVCFSWIGNPPNSPGDVTLIAEAPGRGAEVGSICRRTIDLLGSIGVKILLCSSTVPDTVRFCLAAVDIVVIDCIPSLQMQLFSEQGCAVFDGEADCWLYYGVETAAESAKRTLTLLSFAFISRIFVDDALGFESYFCFRGIKCTQHCGDLKGTRRTRQLILTAHSASAGGLYRRLISRCLRLLVSACDDRSSPYRDGLHVVPGGGAAEVLWSVLWECVAARISSMLLNTKHNDAIANSLQHLGDWLALRIVIEVARGYSRDRPIDFEQVDHDFYTCAFNEAPHTQCSTCCNIAKLHLSKYLSVWRSVSDCEEVCKMISSAYLFPPHILLANNSATAVSGCSTVGGTVHAASLLIKWKEFYKVFPGATTRTASGLDCGVKTSDIFCDPFENGIISSSSLFLEAFEIAMFAARQQFRLHSTTSVVDYKVNRIDKNLHNSVRSANRHTRAALYSRVDLIGQSRLRREFYKAADSIK